jgi:hypothetical protein
MPYVPVALMAALSAVVFLGDVAPTRAAGLANARRFVCNAQANGGTHTQPQGFGSPRPSLTAAEQSALKACTFVSAPGLGSTCRVACSSA